MTSLAPDLRFAVAGRSHVGCVRTLNEDRLLQRPDLGLWAVADGMGGHHAGEKASQLVVEALDGVGRPASGYALLKAVSAALRRANGELIQAGESLPGGGIIGATVAALIIFEGHYACVWAGDARIYRLRGGELARLTRDHSVVQRLIDRGDLSPDEARHHRSANVVTRAVGAAPTLDLEVAEGALEPGDLYLICSDGLTGAVDDAALAAKIARGSLETVADGLLDHALIEGATDNVTFVLVRAEAA